MSRNRDQDCCEYREQKRKLARQKLRVKMMASQNVEKKRDDDCDDEDEETEIEQERKCDEKRAQRIEALSKLLSLGDEMMRRIKPSIDERDKYSMSYRHIRCFLEPAEIERMELEKRMRSILKCMPCETIKNQQQKFDKYQVTVPNTRKKKKRKKKKKDKKPNKVVDEQEKKEEQVENKRDSATEDEEEADPQPEEEMEEPKKDEEKAKIEKEKRANKSEFWCREVKKKEKPKRNEKQFEIDCKDSICSFDSELDLSGLALTKEDLRKIAEKRRSKMASKSKDNS